MMEKKKEIYKMEKVLNITKEKKNLKVNFEMGKNGMEKGNLLNIMNLVKKWLNIKVNF